MLEHDLPSDHALASERFSLDQLSVLAGMTPRTVRYYIAEGLLDRPLGEKRGAHYARRHLEQLLAIRRWTEAGLSLERVRELRSGSLEDPAPRRAPSGTVEIWSRITVADGFEIHVEPGRADLTPEQVRSLVRDISALYRRARSPRPEATPGNSTSKVSDQKGDNNE